MKKRTTIKDLGKQTKVAKLKGKIRPLDDAGNYLVMEGAFGWVVSGYNCAGSVSRHEVKKGATAAQIICAALKHPERWNVS